MLTTPSLLDNDDVNILTAAADGKISTSDDNSSCWAHLVIYTDDVVAVDLVNSAKGDEFECIQNRDTNDFTNDVKNEHFVLKQKKDCLAVDLPDKTQNNIVNHM